MGMAKVVFLDQEGSALPIGRKTTIRFSPHRFPLAKQQKDSSAKGNLRGNQPSRAARMCANAHKKHAHEPLSKHGYIGY